MSSERLQNRTCVRRGTILLGLVFALVGCEGRTLEVDYRSRRNSGAVGTPKPSESAKPWSAIKKKSESDPAVASVVARIEGTTMLPALQSQSSNNPDVALWNKSLQAVSEKDGKDLFVALQTLLAIYETFPTNPEILLMNTSKISQQLTVMSEADTASINALRKSLNRAPMLKIDNSVDVPLVGKAFSAGTITASDADVEVPTLTYQWRKSMDGGNSFVDIPGATAAQFEPTLSEAHAQIQCIVTANDDWGGTTSLTSQIFKVQNSLPKLADAVAISGTLLPGGTASIDITGHALDADADLLTTTYQWQLSADGINFVDIPDETINELAIDPAYKHQYLRCKITMDDGYQGITNDVSEVQQVVNRVPVMGAVTSDGTKLVGQSLSCNGTATDADGDVSSYAYLWQVSNDNSSFTSINGATAKNYTLTTTESQKYVRCQITALDGYDSSASVAVNSVGALVRMPPNLSYSSPSAGSFAQTGLTIAGVCESGLTISLSGAGLSAPATIACPAGTFNQAIVFSAGEGNKEITITQTDSVGNSSTATRTFVRDNTAPLLTYTSPAANALGELGLTIAGDCETGLTVNLSGAGLLSPNSTVCGAGTFSQAIVFTAGGGNKDIIIAQTDAAANNTSVTRTFVRDSAPEVEAERDSFDFSSVLNGNSAANDVRTNLDLPLTGSNGVTVSWQSNDTTLISIDGTVSRPASSQMFPVTLTATFSKNGATATKQQTFEVRGRKQVMLLPGDTASGSSAPHGPVSCAAVSGNTWLLGTSYGLNVTIDGGTTWSHLTRADGLPFNNIASVAIVGGNWIVGSEHNPGSLAVSSDGGKRWRTLVSAKYAAFTSPEGTLYTLDSNQETFETSDDLGLTWSSSTLPIPGGSTGLCFNSRHPIAAQGSSVAMLSYDCDSSYYVGIYASFNKGQTWTTIPSSEWDYHYAAGIDIFGSTLAVSTDSGQYFSVDGGTTWSHPSTNSANTALARSNLMLFGLDSGVSRSVNSGSSWDTITTGFGLPYVEHLMGPISRLFAATCPNWNCSRFGNSALSISTDNGATWSNRALSPMPQNLASFSVDGLRLSYTEEPGSAVVTSADGGATWNAYGSNYRVVRNAGGATYLTDTSNLYKSTNGGASIGVIFTSLNGISHVEADGTSIAVAISSYPPQIFVSTNAGTNWTAGTSAYVSNVAGISSLAIRGNRIVVATSAGVGFSVDGGVTWGEASPINGKMAQWQFSGSAVGNDGTLFASHFGSLFFSKDDGATWTEKSKPSSFTLFDKIAVNGSKVIINSLGGEGVAGYDMLTDTWRVWNQANIALDSPRYIDFDGTSVFAAGGSFIYKFPWTAQ